MKTPRFSLTTRIFLSSAGIVIAVMAVTLALTQRSAMRAAEASITLGLQAAEARVQGLVNSERAQLASRARIFAESPEYRANIESDTGDFLDYTQTAAEVIGAAWVQLVSREGMRRAKSDDPTAPNEVIGSPLARAALEGTPAEGFGVAGDTALIQVVSVPIRGAGDRIIGALMAAKFVTDSIARAVGSETQSQIVFYVLDRNTVPALAAASDEIRRSSDTLLALLGTDSNSVQLAGGSTDTTTRVAALQRVTLEGEHFVSRSAILTSVSGAPVGGFMALRSLDRQLDATGYSRLRDTLLVAGAGGLFVALLIGFLTARRIVRPVTLLADASRRAAEGDYNAQIPEGGRDEIGTLASAFRRLLADLKDKQALVDFLSVSASAATRAAVASGSTATTVRVPTGGDLQALAPGQLLANRYEIKSVLGVGGMGMVYKANDRELGEVLALKTLKPQLMAVDSNALERFKSEIRLARRIAHRNVVRTYDLGESGGLYYISMEYVEGKSLKELIRERGRLPASAVLPIAKQLCRALEVSHDEGVIHRDIKPQNMVVQADGVLKVMDFGIARLASRPAESGHTQRGMVVGTPEYMAPEQLLGDELDVRADLYATGVVLYECLVGKVPLTAEMPITLIAKVLEETPRSPREVQPDVPQALSDLVMWALSKDREKRPRTAAELHTRLDLIAAS